MFGLNIIDILFFKVGDRVNIKVNVPSQALPSPFNTYPALQVQVYDPTVFVQPPFVASQRPELAAHSSTSELKQNDDDGNNTNNIVEWYLKCRYISILMYKVLKLSKREYINKYFKFYSN